MPKPDTTHQIYCCGCKKDVPARLTNGTEIYPHRPDLFLLPFWVCDGCGNCVGCHHKTDEPTKPLGNIATPELKRLRQQIHALLDPLWIKSGRQHRRQARGRIYAEISAQLGYEYHTGEIKTPDEAQRILHIVQSVAASRKTRTQ